MPSESYAPTMVFLSRAFRTSAFTSVPTGANCSSIRRRTGRDDSDSSLERGEGECLVCPAALACGI